MQKLSLYFQRNNKHTFDFSISPMTFGDALSEFGKAYAIVVAVVTTTVCLIVIKKIYDGDATVVINGVTYHLDKYVTLGSMLAVAIVWLVVWATQEYHLFSQIEGGLGAFNIAQMIL